MITITLKINEHTVKGKEFLETLYSFCDDPNDIEIIKVPNSITQNAIDNAKKGIGLNKSTSHEDLMKKLLS